MTFLSAPGTQCSVRFPLASVGHEQGTRRGHVIATVRNSTLRTSFMNRPDSENAPQQWVNVAAGDQVAEGAAIEVVSEGQIVAIFRQQGQLYALDGMCAHQGGPLAEGRLEAGCVTCPWHGWQYELATGIQTVNRRPLQKTYQVRERDGRVEVLL